ncbi:MAG TPA: universal stress protein [Acidimicrobiia bacterium]|nr:universal stress protein [Acidimicrobiia bacterium]
MTVPIIVVGVDGSDGGDRALTAAAEFAAASHYGVVVVHVAHVPAVVATTSVGAAEFAVAADELADYCHLACELTFAGTAVAWSFKLRHGDPATELLRADADHDAAWIAVGRHGHRRLARLALGSVTDRLVRHANRPILIVPPAWS